MPIRKSNRKCIQPSRYAGVPLHQNLLGVTNSNTCFILVPNRSSLTVLPKLSDFERDEPDAWNLQNVKGSSEGGM